jgi:transposase
LEKTMLAGTSLTECPAAIRVDLGAIFVSMELSRSKWLITSLSPGGGEKMSKHTVTGGDLPGLFERFTLLQGLQEKVRARNGFPTPRRPT